MPTSGKGPHEYADACRPRDRILAPQSRGRVLIPLFRRMGGLLQGNSLRARALRGTALTFFGFGFQQFLRLLSNLVLTRLLFPEAFGIMALVTVTLTGLQMLSDTGMNSAIIQSPRGDDSVFLNTAWTLRAGRGVFLALLTAMLALPMAQFYDQPQLAELLPVAGLTSIFMGLQSTKELVANRHLILGRLTLVEVASQAVGIAVMVLLAYLFASVWALLIGSVVGAALRALLSHVALPGRADRLGWEHDAARELFHFGKYIFVSSIAGFFVNNADRAVLGKFVTAALLGIYNIGYFMSSVPFMLSLKFNSRVLMPLYARTPPRENPENRRKIRLARFLLTGGLVFLGLVLSLIGDRLIHLLYEDTYALAGPVMVLLSLSQLPAIVTHPYGMLLLGAGNSRDFTIHLLLLSTVQVVMLIWLVKTLGLMGAVLAPALAILLVYPATAFFAWREKGWDPLLDFGFLLLIAVGAAGTLYVNDTAIATVLNAPMN